MTSPNQPSGRGLFTARQRELLGVAEIELRDGISTPSHGLLADNGVTLDEAYDLAEHIALGISMLLRADEEMGSTSGLARQVGANRIVDALLGGAEVGRG